MINKVGIIELLSSKKGTLSLLVLACSTTALLLGKLDSSSYAAIITIVASIYHYTTNKIDLANIKNKNEQ
jgi:peroxiredoxin family protein